MNGKSKEARRKLQAQIREVGLSDFKEWVSKCSTRLSEADGKGDTKGIFNLVKAMEGKREKPSKNITTDKKDDNLLTCAEDVAEAWRTFLDDKFSATQEEALRPPMEPLPEPAQGEVLTEEEILKGLAKSNVTHKRH